MAFIKKENLIGSPFFVHSDIYYIIIKQVNCLLNKYLLVISTNNNDI